MKRIKKLVSLLLAMMLVLGLSVTAFADEEVTGKGSITITDSNTTSGKVSGRTFAAYKILNVRIFRDDKGDESYVYEVPAELESFYRERYKIGEDVTNLVDAVVKGIEAESDMFEFGKAVLTAAKEAGVVAKEASAAEGAAKVTIGDLELGYYVVEDITNPDNTTAVSALMINTTQPNVSITIKADSPSVTKRIVEKAIQNGAETDTEVTVDSNNAAVGDTISFQVTSKVPDMTGYTSYTFTAIDSMDKGLTFNDDVMITIGDKELVKGTDFTCVAVPAETGDGTEITIDFVDFIQYAGNKGADIVIKYSATVNKNAEIGVSPNKNTIKVIYSKDPGNDKETGETPDSTTKTYVTGIQLKKVDPSGKSLTGAQFQITGAKQNIVVVKKTEFVEAEDGTYYLLQDGTYTETEPTTDTEDQYVSTEQKYSKVTTTETIQEGVEGAFTATAYVDENGLLAFEGLSAGTYTIKELIAPDGYNLLTDPITVTIGWNKPAGDTDDCKWDYSAKLGEANLTVTNTGVGGQAAIEVVNQAGSLLPSTGGIGTTMFYVVGAVLVLGAGILLVVKKRMSSN